MPTTSFLRARRARLRPEEVGLRTGARRRVPGLRREELAQLAGVSVAYYTRLEQGQSTNASDGVLDAIARALQLDDAESAHLRSLARPARARRKRIQPERLRPSLALTIESMGDTPAYVVGRHSDVLAWNRAAHALLAGHLPYDAPSSPDSRPNVARLLFLDPHSRELFGDWNRRTRDSVACLRLTAGCFPGDPRLIELVGELTTQSRQFATLWATHPVGECTHSVEHYEHPLVGSMILNEEIMTLPADSGQRVVVITAEPDSPSALALKLLTSSLDPSLDRDAGGLRAGPVSKPIA